MIGLHTHYNVPTCETRSSGKTETKTVGLKTQRLEF